MSEQPVDGVQNSGTDKRREGNAIQILLPQGFDYDQLDWGGFLSRDDVQFEGNVTNGANLMACFVDGRTYLRDQLRNRGLTQIKYPKIWLLTKEHTVQTPIFHNPEIFTTVISKKYLENASKADLTGTYAFRSDGKVNMETSLPDFFGLAGVEETYHAVYDQFDTEPPVSTVNLPSQVEHDAIETEFRAIKWKIRYAEARGMSPETIGFLQNDLKNAREYRKTHRQNEPVEFKEVR